MTSVGSSEEPSTFVLVENIPLHFRVVDLRSFFSDFIERNKFKIFHYLHSGEASKVQSSKDTIRSKACVVQLVDPQAVTEFIEKYDKTLWRDHNQNTLASFCLLQRIKLPKSTLSSLSSSSSSTLNEGDDIRVQETYKEKKEQLPKTRAVAAILPELQAPLYVLVLSLSFVSTLHSVCRDSN
jgi:hypothetical protein